MQEFERAEMEADDQDAKPASAPPPKRKSTRTKNNRAAKRQAADKYTDNTVGSGINGVTQVRACVRVCTLAACLPYEPVSHLSSV
jgi:hypothetical protein